MTPGCMFCSWRHGQQQLRSMLLVSGIHSCQRLYKDFSPARSSSLPACPRYVHWQIPGLCRCQPHCSCSTCLQLPSSCVSAHTPLEGQFVSWCCLMSRLSAKKYRWRQSLTLGWAAGGCWYGSKLVTQRRGNTPAVPADADGCGRALHPMSVLLTCGPCSWGAPFLAASKPGPLFSAAACWWLFPVPCCCSPAPREQGSAGVSCLALIYS